MGQRRKLGTQSRPLPRLAGSHALEPSPVSSWACNSRKLGLEWSWEGSSVALIWAAGVPSSVLTAVSNAILLPHFCQKLKIIIIVTKTEKSLLLWGTQKHGLRLPSFFCWPLERKQGTEKSEAGLLNARAWNCSPASTFYGTNYTWEGEENPVDTFSPLLFFFDFFNLSLQFLGLVLMSNFNHATWVISSYCHG